MPTFELTGPDGKKYRLTPPANATQEEIDLGIKQFISGHSSSNPTLPVLPLSVTNPPPTMKPWESLVGGQAAAFEKGPPPDWLSTLEENVLPPLGGFAAAGVAAPVASVMTGATAGGATAPAAALEAMAFGAGEQAAQAGIRGLNRALGYRVPEPSSAGKALEFAGSSVAYPVGSAVAEGLPKAAANLFGVTARREAREKAAEEMAVQVDKLADLHAQTVDIADSVAGGFRKGAVAAEKGARKAAGEKATAAPTTMIETLGGPTEQELEARALSLRSSAALRAQQVAPIEHLYQNVQRDLGSEYEKLLNPYLKEPVPEPALLALGQSARDLEDESQQYAIPSSLKALIAKAKGWGTPEGEATAKIGGRQISIPVGATSGGVPIGSTAQAAPPTWEELKQLRDQLRPYFDAKHPPSRSAARQLDSAVTDAYANGGLPIDPDLNMRYRDWRQRWTAPAIRTLHNARTPEQLASIVNENTMGPLLASGDPDARRAVATVAARVIRDKQLTPEQIVQRFSPGVLRDIFGPGADDVAKWATVNYRTSQLDSILKASPELGKQFQQDVNQAMSRSIDEGATRIKDAAIKFAEKLGKPGKDLVKQLRGMTNQEAALFYLERMSKPEFGQQMIEAARSGASITGKQRLRLGAVPFAAGLAVTELYLRGVITSPYVVSVPFAIGGEAALGALQGAIPKLIESNGMKATVQLLNRVWAPATRKVALKTLGKRLGQIAASDAFRAALSDDSDEGLPSASGQPTASALPPAP